MKESEMKKFQILAALLMATALTTSTQVSAHHSAAMFDLQKSVELKGTIVAFKWTNPHSWLELEVPTASGSSERWSIEMTSPNNLVLVGWKRTSFRPGDKATVVVHPLRDGSKGGTIVSAILPDGTKLNGG